MRHKQFIRTAVVLVIAAVAGAGCGGSMFSYKGDRVTQQNLILPLEGGTQKGEWKTNELAISFQYQATPASMKMDGTIDLVGGFSIGFNSIKNLVVYLLFLDNQGVVIQNIDIYSIGNYQAINSLPMLFENTSPIPEGAQKISFAYDGELVDSSDEGATAYNIGFSPSRK